MPQPLEDPEDDIDTALNNLQISLDGGQASSYSSGKQSLTYIDFP